MVTERIRFLSVASFAMRPWLASSHLLQIAQSVHSVQDLLKESIYVWSYKTQQPRRTVVSTSQLWTTKKHAAYYHDGLLFDPHHVVSAFTWDMELTAI